MEFLGVGTEGERLEGLEPLRGPTLGFLQAPTERQLRYKEKVAELRKKRNSGLSKEQKEKYMVKAGILSFHSPWDGIWLSQSSRSIPS